MTQHSDTLPSPACPDYVAVLDIDGLCTLASVLGPERTTRMITTFFVDAERRLAHLDRDDAEPADLQEHAHAVISMAGHLGLKQLSGMCMDLQERARQGGGLDGLPALRHAVRRAQIAVHAAAADGVLGKAPVRDGIRATTPQHMPAGIGREKSLDGGQAAAG